ncbi:MAG: glycosyltransferase family 2 protein [Acidobacteria bacterium]|nr:MAG: glycosyltransferase family 2 protein [Acidobacteriota bacterium]
MELNQISAVIICCNEEEKIEEALKSVRGIVDETIVVDSGSQDRTVEICRRYTDRVYQRSWAGYRQQKQYATDQARNDWVLSLDADEVVSPELHAELSQWRCAAADDLSGYHVPRKTFFMGRWIQHTSWYPDWQLRLFRRSAGRWGGGRVHESFKVSGTIGRLQGHLHHYTYSNLSEFLQQLDRFSSLAAADLFDRGVRANLYHIIADPPLVFLKNYILRQGFRDGPQGMVVSILSSASTLFKYLKLWELQHRQQEKARH